MCVASPRCRRHCRRSDGLRRRGRARGRRRSVHAVAEHQRRGHVASRALQTQQGAAIPPTRRRRRVCAARDSAALDASTRSLGAASLPRSERQSLGAREPPPQLSCWLLHLQCSCHCRPLAAPERQLKAAASPALRPTRVDRRRSPASAPPAYARPLTGPTLKLTAAARHDARPRRSLD